jgi:hypothetical protein
MREQAGGAMREQAKGRRASGQDAGRLSSAMSPTWIWLQAAIVLFVLIGMVIAITKLV